MSEMDDLPLQELAVLEARYKPLPAQKRAALLLSDLQTATKKAETLLAGLENEPEIVKTFEKLRKHPAISGKMRASEAKTALLDPKNDFLASARHKLAATMKTLERVASGEGNKGEKIDAAAPVALSVIALDMLGGYFAIVQLALGELAKTDKAEAERHQTAQRTLRRCTTILTDSLLAAGLAADVR